tara:strand:+ start:10905 stop:12512 length:1608 start_codon:yes stop_codon:yes gene_type:complete
MAEQLPRGLLADPAVQRAMLLPVARRTYTDPGDDITEEQALELAMPGLLYDPMMGMAQTGAMLMGRMPVDPNVMTQTMLDAPLVGGLLGAATGAVPEGAVLGAFSGRGKGSGAAHARPLNPTNRSLKGINDSPDDNQPPKAKPSASSRLPQHLVPLTDDKLEAALPSTKYLVKKIREKAPDAELGLSFSQNQAGKSNYLTLTHPNKRSIEIRLSDHSTGINRAFESAAQLPDYVPKGGKPKFGQVSRESFDKRIDEVLSYYDDGIELGANKGQTAALPGLLDDTASRMQRAQDMGFDVDNPVYHGTPDVRPINEMGFATPSELLLKKPQRGPYFFSKDRPTAATYADDRRAFDYQNAEPEVIKAFIKQENPLVIDAKGATYDGIDADKIIKQFADSPDKETVARQVKKYAAIMNGKVNSDQLAALASRLGRDGVVIKNVRDTYEGKGKPTDVFMVLGAENIRRTTAKFDPAKADSADLLAANPATAALPGLLQDRSGNIDQRSLLSRTPRRRTSFPMRGLLGQRLYNATTPDGAI